MIQLTGIGHVLLVVSNLSRERDFYTGVLGFKILEADAGHGGTFLSLDEGRHAVDLVEAPGSLPPELTEDLEQMSRQLAGRLGAACWVAGCESRGSARCLLRPA
jgi:catechol 2,3-dioxygenase-like lactoylglutathione lyase family enzyme